MEMAAMEMATERAAARERVLATAKYRMANAARNREALEGAPHLELLGMAALYYAEQGGGEPSLVDWRAAARLGISPEELDAAARRNAEGSYLVMRLEDVLAEMLEAEGMPLPKAPGPETMLVITTGSGMHGAPALLDAATLDRAAARLGGECIIIPSSVHELIAVPAGMGVAEVESVMRSVNDGLVDADEVLGYGAFRYGPAGRGLRPAGE